MYSSSSKKQLSIVHFLLLSVSFWADFEVNGQHYKLQIAYLQEGYFGIQSYCKIFVLHVLHIYAN